MPEIERRDRGVNKLTDFMREIERGMYLIRVRVFNSRYAVPSSIQPIAFVNTL